MCSKLKKLHKDVAVIQCPEEWVTMGKTSLPQAVWLRKVWCGLWLVFQALKFVRHILTLLAQFSLILSYM